MATSRSGVKKAESAKPSVRRRPAAGKGSTGTKARIRMYRQGIGDSFLLTFPTPSGSASILIDCGVVSGTKDAVAKMQAVADDILAQTQGGKTLNAIVGTHAHWDHLSGFLTARETLKGISGKEIWLGWTENPQDPEGRRAKDSQALQLSALKVALSGLAGATDAATRGEAAAIADLLSFQGPDDAVPGLGATAKLTTDGALEALRGLGTVSYREPGEVIERDWLPGVRVYVLGPPRDRELLGKMQSSKPGDMYAVSSSAALVSALMRTGDAAKPFEPGYLFSPQNSELTPVKPIIDLYNDHAADWRRIDDQWLLSSQTLALDLDNAINNTSLVLAFELVATGEVLLFAADAQIGNWKSWALLQFKIPGSPGERVVTAADLLARTVFYKVGHHASHNATLKEGGLEAMVSPGLVAAIPVDEAFANSSKHWRMPADELYRRLLERTEGRVLRSDGSGPFALAADNTTFDASVQPVFVNNVRVDQADPPLWVELTVV